jgi:hypothetical protein
MHHLHGDPLGRTKGELREEVHDVKDALSLLVDVPAIAEPVQPAGLQEVRSYAVERGVIKDVRSARLKVLGKRGQECLRSTESDVPGCHVPTRFQ